MLNRVQRLAKQVKEVRRIKKTLQAVEVDGEAGGGAVRVRMNGVRRVVSVEIAEKTAASGDAALLAGLVKGAVNDAGRNLDRELSQRMSEMDLPADFGQGGGGLGGLG